MVLEWWNRKELTKNDWQEIKGLREKGLSYSKIGEKFGVSKQNIHQGLKSKYPSMFLKSNE